MRSVRRILYGIIAAGLINTAQAGVYDDMIVAARNDDSAKVMVLVQRGMDVNTADENGTTLTMYAARAGNEKLLEYLLDHRANAMISNRFGDSALLLAALEGHLACIQLLVKAGAQINPDGDGWKPLNYAAFSGRLEVATYLLAQGANVDAKAPNGMTSLMLATRNGFAPVVSLLLNHRADAGIKTSDGKTALDIAREGNQTQIAQLLGEAKTR